MASEDREVAEGTLYFPCLDMPISVFPARAGICTSFRGASRGLRGAAVVVGNATPSDHIPPEPLGVSWGSKALPVLFPLTYGLMQVFRPSRDFLGGKNSDSATPNSCYMLPICYL